MLFRGDVRTDHAVELHVAPDLASAELIEQDRVTTLELERRGDTDTWHVSCGQHYLEETFDVLAPDTVEIGGRTLKPIALSASCSGPSNTVTLFLDDPSSVVERGAIAGSTPYDIAIGFRDVSVEWPPSKIATRR